ncbi:hypothetical protein [Streptacidiphilus sp. PAMC 29251]
MAGTPQGPPGSCCSSAQLWSSTAHLGAEVLPLVAAPVVDSLIGHAGQAQQAVSEGLLAAAGVSAESLAVL